MEKGKVGCAINFTDYECRKLTVVIDKILDSNVATGQYSLTELEKTKLHDLRTLLVEDV